VKTLQKSILFGAALLACGAFGFTWRDIQSGQLPSGRPVSNLLGVKTTAGMTPEQVFKQAYNQIRYNYVKPIKATDLKYAGMQGLMSSLGDPHTLFLPPRAAQAFAEDTRANFFGVGARLGNDPLGAKASSVFEDGPAYAAGLRANDVITGVNGKSVSGRPVDEIVDQIKGKEGTFVTLKVIRKGVNDPIVMKIRRARIVTPTVESKFFPESKVGYMQISQFAEPTALQFDKELVKLEQNDIKGLVIDLRGNPGGLLETSAEMLSRFVENKVVVKMRGRDGREEVVRTYAGAVREFNYPIVALINEDSASAAEIFAGCLRDYGKATLVGEHSYGKASVQNVFPLVDRSSAKITIAKYYLPSGTFIGRKVDEDGVFVSGGLEPNVKIELDLDKDPTPGDPKTDNQLARAIQVVLEKQ
jgi:carboxyl-terminal processing protease